jgi:hypothetical protein
VGRWPVEDEKIGLFTHTLAGGDRGCSAIFNRMIKSALSEFQAGGVAPAPQLEVVRPPYSSSFRSFAGQPHTTFFNGRKEV